MPYAKTSDLPAPVRRALPLPAQRIYRAAFNAAEANYGHSDARSARIAWSAVKMDYVKRDGKWVKEVRNPGPPTARPVDATLRLRLGEVFVKAGSHRAYGRVKQALGRNPQLWIPPLNQRRPKGPLYAFIVSTAEFEKVKGITGVGKTRAKSDWSPAMTFL